MWPDRPHGSIVSLKLFACQNCGNLLFFENTACERCGLAVGYLPHDADMSALRPDGDRLRALGAACAPVRFCANADFGACNWLLAVDEAGPFCVACRHNRTVPAGDDPDTLALWRRLEQAKHRLFHALLRLRIPLPNRVDDPVGGLAFDFLAELPGEPPVLTGHSEGLVTIDVREADDAYRENMRHRMHETYRTLLGHFRHEIGHWIWNRLVRDRDRLEPFRAAFGDERQDYAGALRRHYDQGPPADWQRHGISAYATAHPWEDFAESWAHYLHIMDTLETAASYGLGLQPGVAAADGPRLQTVPDPYDHGTMDEILSRWLPLASVMNSLNRSMGLGDPYPFVISDAARLKLGFIHALVCDR